MPTTDPINNPSATPARLTFGPVSLTLYPSDGAVIVLVDPTAGYHIDFSYGQASGGTEQFCHKIVISRPLPPVPSAPLPAADAPLTAPVSRPIEPPSSAPTESAEITPMEIIPLAEAIEAAERQAEHADALLAERVAALERFRREQEGRQKLS